MSHWAWQCKQQRHHVYDIVLLHIPCIILYCTVLYCTVLYCIVLLYIYIYPFIFTLTLNIALFGAAYYAATLLLEVGWLQIAYHYITV